MLGSVADAEDIVQDSYMRYAAAPPDDDYDNVIGGTVPDLAGKNMPVRPGTDAFLLLAMLLVAR